MVAGGGHAWLPEGCAWLPGGVRGCRGTCVVAGGHAWLQGGGHAKDTKRYGQ